MQSLSDAISNVIAGGVSGGIPSSDTLAYLLNEDFTPDESAPPSSPRTCQPGPGTLTIVDTGSLLDFTSSDAVFSGTPLDWTSCRFNGEGVTRTTGQILTFEFTRTNSVSTNAIGWDTDTSSYPYEAAFRDIISSTDVSILVSDATFTLFGLSNDVSYQLAIVTRPTSGYGYYVKGGDYTDWTLLYQTVVGSTATLYPAASSFRGGWSMDYLRVVDTDTLTFQKTAIASDSFDRSDGAIGDTDGAGCEEGGGDGLTWTAVSGWIIQTVLSNNAVSGASAGGSIVDLGISDVVCEGVFNWLSGASGSMGFAPRTTSSTDFWLVDLQDTTTFRLLERTGGSSFSRATAAITVSNDTDYNLQVTAIGQTIAGVFNNATAVRYTSATSHQSVETHGITLTNSSTSNGARCKQMAIFNANTTDFPSAL